MRRSLWTARSAARSGASTSGAVRLERVPQRSSETVTSFGVTTSQVAELVGVAFNHIAPAGPAVSWSAEVRGAGPRPVSASRPALAVVVEWPDSDVKEQSESTLEFLAPPNVADIMATRR